MTNKEIEREIKREKSRIKRLEERITDIQYDISASRKALKYWEGLLAASDERPANA